MSAPASLPSRDTPKRPKTVSLTEDARPLRIVIVGHVDHGKSTLVGRLFHDTGSLPDGKLEAIQAMCERRGVPFEWAFLMDAFKSERDQNITIDTAQIWFQTAKRPYVIIDAPGHKEFLKNMVTGAAQADAALLLIAADEGVQEQSRRHGTLLSLLGVKQVYVVVNKIDRVGYDEQVFQAIEKEYRAFLAGLGVEPRGFVPVSAREGDNVAARSTRTAWYRGPTIVELLDGFEAPEAPANGPLRFCVQDVYRFDHRRILAGRVESGTIKVGDTVVFQPSGKRSRVASLETWSGPAKTSASAGESIGVTLEEQIFVERGHVGVVDDASQHAAEASRLLARVFWMGRRPLEVGRQVKLKLATQEVKAHIARVDRVLDASTLEVRQGKEQLDKNDVAEVEIVTKTPLAFDDPARAVATGRFVLVDEYDLAGGGVMHHVPYPEAKAAPERPNAPRWTPVTADERHTRQGHRGALLWLVGRGPRLELARVLERALFDRGVSVVVVDGARVSSAQGSDGKPQAVILDVARSLVDAGLVALTLPLETVVPRAPGTDLFFEVRVGRPQGVTPDVRRLVVDPEEAGLEAAAAALLDAVLPQIQDIQREWFYAI